MAGRGILLSMNEPKPVPPRSEQPAAPLVPEAAPKQEASATSIESAADNRSEAERPLRAPENSAAPEVAPAPATVVAVERAKTSEAAVAPNDPALMKVERILEAGLWDVYVGMPEPFRTQFKKLGEDTSLAVRAAVIAAQIKASVIHALVHKWLAKIPGVNEFFLLQESKIKTDQLVRLATWLMQKGHII